MKFHKVLPIVLLAIGVIFTGCEKDDDSNSSNNGEGDFSSSEREVTLVMRPVIGGNALQLGTNSVVNGQSIQFDFFKFYISGIALVDSDGNTLADNAGLPLLIGTEQNEMNIGSTDATSIHELRFDIGLDAETNHADPSIAEGVLNDVEMHWNWNPNQGYRFFRMDYRMGGGFYESHAVTNLSYREGVVVNVQEVSMDGDNIYIVIDLDLEMMFSGNPFEAQSNHGPSPFNNAYLDALASGLPFVVQ